MQYFMHGWWDLECKRLDYPNSNFVHTCYLPTKQAIGHLEEEVRKLKDGNRK